jgi:hypothetical protein
MHDQCNPANVERLAKKRKIDEQPNDPESRAIANDDDSLSDSQQSSLSEKICLWQGDMTKLKIGAIVNAANEQVHQVSHSITRLQNTQNSCHQLCPGGGICGAIYRAAGLKALDKEVRRRYPDGCVMGSTAVTPGFALPAKFIMHTVGTCSAFRNQITMPHHPIRFSIFVMHRSDWRATRQIEAMLSIMFGRVRGAFDSVDLLLLHFDGNLRVP